MVSRTCTSIIRYRCLSYLVHKLFSFYRINCNQKYWNSLEVDDVVNIIASYFNIDEAFWQSQSNWLTTALEDKVEAQKYLPSDQEICAPEGFNEDEWNEHCLISICAVKAADELWSQLDLGSLSVEALESLLRTKPEKPAPATEARLCQGRFYEECPSSAITDTVYTAGVTGMDFWGVSETSLNGEKNFSKGHVELQIRDRFDLTDFAEIAYQAKEVIAQQFGEQTLKLHYALATIAFRKPEAWNEDTKVSISKLLADFGEDKKFNHYIRDAPTLTASGTV